MNTGWLTTEDADVVRYARVLPLDIVQAKGAGHAGTAVSLTPAMYVLFQEFLRHDPQAPDWQGRDRFILSCGHASLALYLQLFLSGYGLKMHDLKTARTLDSRTPGHPEYGHTPGVETTTGPLGQGIGNAVGVAMESVRLQRLLGTSLFSPRVWCFASDGDLEEGISHEASSLAGTLQLDNLILVWDDNRISIEGDTAVAFTEDVAARYRAYGWHVLEINDAENPAEIRDRFTEATQLTGKPVFICLRTRIGNPMPALAGTAAAHSGAPGIDEVRATKLALGLDDEAEFCFPDELLTHARRVGDRGKEQRLAWESAVAEWRAAQPAQASLFDRMASRDTSTAVAALDALRAAPRAVATRVASNAILNAVVPLLPELWGGSADLAESNGTKIDGAESYLPPGAATVGEWDGAPGGQIVHFGIREHAMGAILNGMALSGLTRPFGATFFVFSDYMRPSVRLAALMNLPVTYVWSHDSVAVGEDGPTHQPLEHLWSYRAVLGLAVVRPADWVETVDVWRRILTHTDGPHAVVLSRQGVPVMPCATTFDSGAARGAYIASDSEGSPEVVLIATGSEVGLALDAAAKLRAEGLAVRVVSAPCLEWFEQEDSSYRDHVLPPAVQARVSVEAGSDIGWYRWVGSHGRTVSISEYGQSGAGDILLERLGVSVDAIVAAAHDSIRSQSTQIPA
ncbi:transketolase [Microbacterium sp. YY-01]|uniref:transketolase n=1 Tax=Microbacterium sp. YY-01 TaxID=3421634 RepID=UPI003D16DCAC